MYSKYLDNVARFLRFAATHYSYSYNSYSVSPFWVRISESHKNGEHIALLHFTDKAGDKSTIFNYQPIFLFYLKL